MIEIRTLGRIEVVQTRTGALLDLAHQPKCFSLLVYLAVERRSVQRALLASLLYPELDESHARGALRQLLFRLTRSVGDAVVRDGRQAVRIDTAGVRCDAADLRRLLGESRHEEALAMYEGDFLSGFHVPDSAELERWIEEERQGLLKQAVDGAWELVRGAQSRGDLPAARKWARWALSRTPYDEERLREYLLLLREAGQALEAAAAYQDFARRLRDELELTPSPGTRRLVEDIAPAIGSSSDRQDRNPQWRPLCVRSRMLSQNTLEAIRRTSGIRWEHHVERPFFRTHLQQFLESSAPATALVGPAGYGKTVGLGQAVEALWLAPSACDSADIVWFVQMRDLGSLAARGADVAEWLLAQMGFGGSADHRNHFRLNPHERRGNIVLILDGLDEHSLRLDLLDGLFAQLVALIGSIREPWFRVVLSMRTSAWQRFGASVRDAPAFQELWYGVSFDGAGEDPSNVPPLTEAEVQAVIGAMRESEADQSNCIPHPDTALPIDVLRHPFFLQLFLQSRAHAMPLDRVEIVEQFIQRRVHSPPYSVEKAELLRQVLKETAYGERRWVAKSDLLGVPESRKAAYRALVSNGVLLEEERKDASGLPVTTARVAQPLLFEILVARHWIKEAGTVSYTLLEEVAERYEGNALRLAVLSWLVGYALKSGAFDALVPVFHLPVTPEEKRHLARVLGYGVRRSEKARRYLVPRWAADPAAQDGYFETFVDQDYLVHHFMDSLRLYQPRKRDRQSQVFAHSLLFLGNLLKLDAEGCRREALSLLELSPDGGIHPLPLGRAMGALLLYHHYLGDGAPEDLIERTVQFAEADPRSQDEFRGFPVYHLFVMEALNLCGSHDRSLRVLELALEQHPRFSVYQDRTTFHSMLLSHHGLALLEVGDGQGVGPIVAQLRRDSALRDPHTYPTYHYSRIHVLWFEAEYRRRQGDAPGALDAMRQVIETSRQLGFRFFEVRALSWLSRLHAAIGDREAAGDVQQASNRILASTGFRNQAFQARA